MSNTQFMLITGLLLGFATGIIMHRSDFCLAGIFRDLFLFKSLFMLRILLLLVIISATLFEIARLSGLLRLYPFPLLGSPSLTAPLGGMIFGIGMVLAGGCVVGSLYKTGAGSVSSLVTIVGLIVGSAIYAELFPWWSSINASSSFLKGKVTLAQVVGIEPTLLIASLVILCMPLFIKIHRQGLWVRKTYTEGSLQPWVAALLLAFIGLISSVTIGMPLGITSSYAKAAAVLEGAFCPDHYATLKFFQVMPMKYIRPFTETLLIGGPGKAVDAIALVQFPLILGIIFGSTLSALQLREFKVRWKLPLRQYLSAAAGGILMGLASRMAAGCNVWHLLGGLPIISLQSMLFVFGLFPGAWLGAKFLASYVIH